MPQPKKYNDFVVSEPYTKESKQASFSSTTDAPDGRMYVNITCPHCEKPFKELLECHLGSKRADLCLNHLRECETAQKRGIRVSPAPKKRALEGTASEPAADTTVLTARCDTLVKEKADLQCQVGVLTDKVRDLEMNSVSKDAFAALQETVATLQENCARQEQDMCTIANKLGFDRAPPLPDIKQLVQSIDTLKAPPRSMTPPPPSARTRYPLNQSYALNPQAQELKQQNRALRKRAEKLSAAMANQQEQTAKDHKRLAKARRELQCKFHPDKHRQYRDTEHMATEISKLINELAGN